ncbi:MAG: response regulator [Candidatus Omnitrophica bacterium]|nr:response regulator [Candidatus Omnitrophota bacterium]
MDKRMLVVDDEKETCENLSSFFTQRGFDVAQAYNGTEALEKIKAAFYPVILLDIKMPDLSGIEVLKEAIKIHPEAKIIMITGYVGEGNGEQECRDLGAHAYLTKPLHLKELCDMIDGFYKEG